MENDTLYFLTDCWRLTAPMENPLRIAILGSGRVAKARVREIGLRADARVVVVSAGEPERAREVAEPASAEVSTDWMAVVARPDVDAVMVCSRNALHEPQAMAALEAGKHVSVDYPLALSLADAERLAALAAERQLVLHVEHIELLSAWFVAFCDALPRVGKIHEISWKNLSARQFAPGDWTFDRASGFSMFQQASLPSRLIRCVGPAEWIEATEMLDGDENGCFRRRDTMISFGFSGGTGRIHDAVGLGTPGASSELVVTGENGVLTARELKEVTFTDSGGAPEPVPIPAAGGLFARDVAEFLARVTHGTPAYVSLDHVLTVFRFADAAERSVATGRRMIPGSKN